MGVPKFYRWISERYPCLSEVVREYQIPEFDNLYLDMNGIIHNCSHPNDEDVHFRISEEKIFEDIFRYIEFLFRMIKPRKVFFMAIDGVAPRAKMNQQRGRRFRSAKEAQTREDEAKNRGEKLPEEKRFDSNCITPGTEFMDRLHQHLKYFVANKVTNDELWRDVKVILSGHETPGEGEHKIMDFIRYEKSQSNYDPNTRHCLYGLDADLIMLGMCSHEPHFSLLREEVKYIRSKTEKNKRDSNPEAITFHLLHLSLFREYLEHEFSELKTTLRFPYNLENIIDDWVLMGFLVGNDFIPHIPHFHINKSSLLKLYAAYKKVMPSLDGYLNENGKLNLHRFQQYLNELKSIDIDNFNDTYADLKYFQSKTGRKYVTRKPLADTSAFFSDGPSGAKNKGIGKALQEAVQIIDVEDSDNESIEYESDDIYESSDSDMFLEEFKSHKRDYYMNKLNYEDVNNDVLKEQAHEYIRAIQWNLHYYYNGCMSWGWFYPHHYAPYISDVDNFDDIDLNFEMGKPFKPFEQLLAVLPSASKDLLPKAYESLVTSESSELKDFYPNDFETDQNEKQQSWEAVVLIPFIDEKRLLDSVQSLKHKLTSDEVRRNRHGPHLAFTYSREIVEAVSSPRPGILPDIVQNHAKCLELSINAFRIPIEAIHKGLCVGVELNSYIPGFPTLRHIPHDVVVRKERVRVFESASMGENTILIIRNEENYDIESVAKTYLNKTVFVNWPHLLEAKVFCVSNASSKYILDRNRLICEPLEDNEGGQTYMKIKSIERKYKERWGVIVGEPDIILQVYPMTGRKYIPGNNGKLILEKQWSKMPMLCHIQTVVKDINIFDPHIQQFQTLYDVYPKGAKCFPIEGPYYGSMAQVLECEANKGFILVEVFPQTEPDLREIQERATDIIHDRYIPNYVLAQRLGISSHLLSRILGTIFVRPPNPDSRKVNIGLNLKFNQKNEEIPGFSIKRDDVWLFSDKVFKIMEQYLTKYPFVFERLSTCVDKDLFSIDDLIPGENKQKILDDLQNWLRSLPSAAERRQKCDAKILDEFVVEAIEDVINTHIVFPKEMPPVVNPYRPNQLFRPIPYLGYSLPDPKATYDLFDRVVNIRTGISVPLGAKGTIIGIHLDDTKEVNSLFDVVFDEKFAGGLTVRCSPGKGYKLSPANLLNITYGLKVSGKFEQFVNSGQPLQSKPQHMSHNYRHSKDQNYGRYQFDYSFNQRMPRPRLQYTPPFVNTNLPIPQTAISVNTLNHSKTSPFQSPKHENQKNEEFPPMKELWNVLTNMNANDKTLPKGSFADITAPKRVMQNPNLSKPEVTDRTKSNPKTRNQKPFPEQRKVENKSFKHNIELVESCRQLLVKASEQYYRQSPKFEISAFGPMKSKAIKLTLPDGQNFHTLFNVHQNEFDAYEYLCREALDYINKKFAANIDVRRTEKLLPLPSFVVPNQSSPNRPKIAASSLPRPPSEWTTKTQKQPPPKRREPEIPESFVEHNERILRQLEKEKLIASSKTNINTSVNKDRNFQPKKLFDNKNDNLLNTSQNSRPTQNRNQRKVQNDSVSDNTVGNSNPFQRRSAQRSSGGQSAFDHQFVPLQVARNNQSQRNQSPHKNSPQKPKNLIDLCSTSSEEVEILTPESIVRSSASKDHSNDDIEILTPESMRNNSSANNSSNKRRRSRGARLVVNLD